MMIGRASGVLADHGLRCGQRIELGFYIEESRVPGCSSTVGWPELARSAWTPPTGHLHRSIGHEIASRADQVIDGAVRFPRVEHPGLPVQVNVGA